MRKTDGNAVRIGLVTYAMRCGGLETFLLRLGKGLAARGYSVELLTTVEAGPWFGLAGEAGISAFDLSCRARSPLVRSWNVIRRIARRAYDVLFLNHAQLVQAALAMLPDNVAAVPILHNHFEDIYKVGCANPRAWNAALGVSPAVAAEARRRVGNRPVLVAPHGIELPGECALLARRRFGKPFRLAYIGRLDQFQKRVLLLPEIMARCVARNLDVTLTIAGEGAERGALESKIAECRLGSRTVLLGGVTPARAYQLLLDSHALILPSTFEGLPLAPLEAQACGCVPVCSMLPGITDAVIENGKTGLLVDARDTDAYSAALEALAGDGAMWSAMSAAGQERVRRSFSIDSMTANYEAIISGCLAGAYPLPVSRRFQPPIRPDLFTWRQHLGLQ